MIEKKDLEKKLEGVNIKKIEFGEYRTRIFMDKDKVLDIDGYNIRGTPLEIDYFEGTARVYTNAPGGKLL